MNRWPSFDHKLEIFKQIGYEPFSIQEPIHRSTATIIQVVGAEGAGKSNVTAAEVTGCVTPFKTDGVNHTYCRLVYLIGQTYDNTHPEFEYLAHYLTTLNLIKSIRQPSQGGWSMSLVTGCEIETLSVERGASVVIATGKQPDIIVLTESGIIQSYSVLLASVRRVTRAMGRAIIVGTLKDNFGWYASLVDELSVIGNAWQGETYSLPAWTNTHLYPGGRNDPEIKRLEAILPDDEFQRTVAAQRVPSRALIFPEFSYLNHVKPCPFDINLPVYLWIDPGYFPSVYAVIPVQFHGPEVWQIDEVYLNGHTHQQVIAVCMAQKWWNAVDYLVMDVAGRQHHAEKSAEEVWGSLTRKAVYSQPVGILDGISRHRTFLGPTPRLFHDPTCTGTLNEYRQYKRHTDRDGNPTSDEPIDANNHSMKAIAYGLVWHFGFIDEAKEIYGVNFLANYRG